LSVFGPAAAAKERSMRILAIDPGNEQSAWVLYDPASPEPLIQFGYEANDDLLARICGVGSGFDVEHDAVAIEMIASYGMAVGREVFETCVWIGRFAEALRAGLDLPTLVYRRDVKLHLCASCKAKDSNVRQALLDKFGPGKAKAVGVKSAPGPLYGVSGDVWSALAVAVTYAETAPVSRQATSAGEL
jgi:hypothetical protein